MCVFSAQSRRARVHLFRPQGLVGPKNNAEMVCSTPAKNVEGFVIACGQTSVGEHLRPAIQGVGPAHRAVAQPDQAVGLEPRLHRRAQPPDRNHLLAYLANTGGLVEAAETTRCD